MRVKETGAAVTGAAVALYEGAERLPQPYFVLGGQRYAL